MWFQQVFDEAKERGEKIRDQFLTQVLGSRAVNDLLSNETFVNTLSKALTAKEKLEKQLSSQLQKAFELVDLPSKSDLLRMLAKVTRIEGQLEALHLKIQAFRGKAPAAASVPASKKKTAAKKVTTKKSGKKSGKKVVAKKITGKKVTAKKLTKKVAGKKNLKQSSVQA